MGVLSINELPSISDSYYKSAFTTFKHSLRNDNRLDFIATLKSKLLPILPPPSQPLRILSVGAGSGEYDYLLLHEIFLPCTSLIHYDAIEPSEELFNMFAERLEEDPVPGVHLHKTTFENFNSTSDSQYDLVLFIHSLYYLPMDSVATAMENFLPPDSGAVVVLMDSASGHAALHRALGLPEGPHMRCLTDVLEPVREIDGQKDLEVLYFPQWVDVEDLFLEESQAGLDLLSFAICKDLRRTQREILDEIRSQAKVHLTMQRLGGRRHWWTPEGVALIHNSSSR
ncbi:hypothetical protein Mapa_002501 [Marchantia paleacea]|nr:hypothetical protein Mapa_002501 [Marchantia paleacea]